MFIAVISKGFWGRHGRARTRTRRNRSPKLTARLRWSVAICQKSLMIGVARDLRQTSCCQEGGEIREKMLRQKWMLSGWNGQIRLKPLTPAPRHGYAPPMFSASTWRRLRLVLFFCLTPVAWAETNLFRLATFNVENYLDAPAGTRHLKSPAAQAKVRDCILAIKPDVLALEEMGATNALLDLQSNLKSSGWSLPFWDEITGYDTNIHVAVLSRFPIVARRPHTNDNFLLDGRRLVVSRGFEELDLQVNPRYRFTLIAAHLKSRLPSALADEEEWRYEEAMALRRVIDAHFAQDPAQNLAVVGDFNDMQDSKPLRAILGRGATRLFDTRPAERNGDDDGRESRRITWTHYYAKDDDYSRIDYILLGSGLKYRWLKEETYILSTPNWGLASDHRPLVAGFLVPSP
jgi:endonuclease/exonuclease/phosphatase family metal-dependent hydrolase